jgi:uncharacterized protein YndB with AHSA1/START domain
MKKLEFEIQINTSREKVWHALWDDKNYREWTSAFTEGSYAESDWKEGSKIHFLDGKGSGMYSIIEKKIGLTQMTFRHLGHIKDGKEQPEKIEGVESYFLTEENNKTNLKVELEMSEDYEKYFNEVFPKALANVKRIAERN